MLKKLVKGSSSIHLMNIIRSDHSSSNYVVFILTTTELVSSKLELVSAWIWTHWRSSGYPDLIACHSAVEGDQFFTHCNLYSTVGSIDQPQLVLHLVNPRQSMNSSIGSYPHANPIFHMHGSIPFARKMVLMSIFSGIYVRLNPS